MKKIKLSALFLGFLASIVTIILGVLFIFVPLSLLMRFLGTPKYQIVDRLMASIVGQVAGSVLVLIVAIVTGYVIARVAKDAPFLNITVYLLIPFFLTALKWLLNVPMPQNEFYRGWLMTIAYYLSYPAMYFGGMLIDKRR